MYLISVASLHVPRSRQSTTFMPATHYHSGHNYHTTLTAAHSPHHTSTLTCMIDFELSRARPTYLDQERGPVRCCCREERRCSALEESCGDWVCRSPRALAAWEYYFCCHVDCPHVDYPHTSIDQSGVRSEYSGGRMATARIAAGECLDGKKGGKHGVLGGKQDGLSWYLALPCSEGLLLHCLH